MAITVSAVKVTLDGTEYDAVKSGSIWIVPNLPLSKQGKAVTAVTVTASGGTAPYTTSGFSSLIVPDLATITVTDSATPTAATKTFTLDLDLQGGFTMKNTINKAGWFNFRRVSFTGKYVTGGITLPVDVAEVLSVECAKATAHEFKNGKIKLYTASNTEYSNNADVTLDALVWLE